MLPMLAQRMSQDELLRSLSSNMGGGGDGGDGNAGTLLLIALAAIAVIAGLAWISRRRQRSVEKRLNHPGKLQKEVVRKVALKPAELKKLKMLADEVDVSSPLVLLLCPSLMADAARKRRSR